MERALASDRAAFEAAFTADSLAFRAERGGQVGVDEPANGPGPSLCIRRRRTEPPAESVTVLVTMGADRPDLLALSVAATDYAPDGTRTRSQTRLAPVFRSPDGKFHLETHVGRLVGEGEFATYFWTLATYRLGIDD